MPGADASHDGEASAAGSTPEGSSSGQKRRRTAGGNGTSSRGVANLTPEQLARKRANDREAQRAIRERTKNQIDRLNQRIHDLESQQPYHDLQLVLLEKEAVQAENADIRKRLESVLSLIQPILRPSGGLNELAAAAERAPARETPTNHDPRPYPSGIHDLISHPNGFDSPASTEPGRQWQYPGSGDASTSHVRRWSAESSHYDGRHAPQHDQSDQPFDERMGVDFVLDNGHRRIDPSLPPPPPQASAGNPSGAQHAPILPHYLILPRNTAPFEVPLDVLMLDFLAKSHTRAAEGVPLKTLSGPAYPNFTALVYPERHIDAHPVSKLFTDILRTFPDICTLPEKVAVVFIMFLVMRWHIDPTQENYDLLPDWVTPRASQLFVPHPHWMNYVPWPKLRDRLITTHPFVHFDTFFVPYTTTISLNWPYEPRDCLLPASRLPLPAQSSNTSIPASSPSTTAAATGATAHAGSPAAGSTPGGRGKEQEQENWVLNPAFESHLRDLKNWSLGPEFRVAFPHLADTLRIKEGR